MHPPESGHRAGTVAMEAVETPGARVSARDCISDAPPTRKRREPAKPALPRRLCSLADAACYLGVSDWTVRQMVWRGDLPHIKNGKRILLDLRDLEGWIEREKVRGV